MTLSARGSRYDPITELTPIFLARNPSNYNNKKTKTQINMSELGIVFFIILLALFCKKEVLLTQSVAPEMTKPPKAGRYHSLIIILHHMHGSLEIQLGMKTNTKFLSLKFFLDVVWRVLPLWGSEHKTLWWHQVLQVHDRCRIKFLLNKRIL